MDKSLVPIDPAILAIMHGSFGQGGALSPFAKEIMLVACQVAGTNHPEAKTIEPSLTLGCSLSLQREPANPHDELAIAVLDEAGRRLGYVPRAKNEALARLMDAGKSLCARVESKTWQGDWLRVELQIFLRDF